MKYGYITLHGKVSGNKLIHCLKKTQCVLSFFPGIHFQRSKFKCNTPMTSWRSISLPRGVLRGRLLPWRRSKTYGLFGVAFLSNCCNGAS